MKLLTREHWHLFKKDGVLFEELTGQILHAKYPDIKFNHTGGPHDGGKDFEAYICDPHKRIEFWAECKYHQDPLPIHDVSMSMTMAVIEKVNKIIFFSYSPVNRNFNKYIAKYKKSAEKQVEVYSDCELENLILEVKDEIDFYKFFPDYIDYEYLNDSEQKLKIAYGLQKSKLGRVPKNVQVNDIVTTELYLTNDSDNAVKADISLNMNSHHNCLNCIENSLALSDYKKAISIPAHTTEMVTFSFRIINHSEKIILPAVDLTVSGNQHIKKNISQKLSCIWLAETELIGTQYIEYLNRCNELISSSGSMVFLTLAGQSGCGKSRLLTELKLSCISHGKKVVEIDADKKILNAKAFVQQIAASLEELPIFSYKIYKKINRIIHENNTENTYALHVLYDKTFKPSEEQDLVIKYLYSLLKEKNAYLLLDNVQNYDETIIELINGIIDLSAKNNNLSGIAFSFNLNFLYRDTKPYNLLRKLKAIASSNRNSAYYDEIAGFSKEEAIQYLNSCLNPNQLNDTDRIEYERCISKIAEIHGNNPFFLKNYVIYLYQNNIIRKNELTSFYISDIKKFQKNIDKMPSTVSALIEIREESMLEAAFANQDEKELYFKFIELLSFLKIMPISLYGKLIGNAIIRDRTDHLGFTTSDNDGNIIFSHIYYYQFFKEKYPYATINNSWLKEFVKKAEKLYLIRKMKCQIYIAKYLTETLRSEDTENIIHNIIHYDIDYDFSLVIFDVVCAILPLITINTDRYINIYKCITEMSLNRFGIETSLKYHEIIFKEFIYLTPKFKNNLADLAPILFEHVTHLMGQWRAEESLGINNQIISVLRKYFSHDENYNTILARLYNFQTNAYNQLDNFDDAIATNRKAMEHAEKSNNKSALITTLKNKGDIYYGLQNSYEYKEKIASCWQKAYNIYIEHYESKDADDTELALKLTIYIKSVLGDMITGNFNSASEKISCLSKYINRTDMMYFEEKLRLVIAEYHILTHTADGYSIELIKQAIDICALYGNQNSYIDCFYMLAVLYMFMENYTLSLDNYYKAYTMIIREIDSNEKSNHFNYFFIDMAIAVRRSKNDSIIRESTVFQQYQNDLVKKIEYILNLNDDDFKNYLAENSRLTPIYDSQYYLNFPKI